MKTQFKPRLFLLLLVITVMAVLSMIAVTAFAAERDRDLVAVESGNWLNMRVSDQGVLTWDAVDGATGYHILLMQDGMSVAAFDTVNPHLALVSEIDGLKFDSGRYLIDIAAKGVTNKRASMTYYYTSNVDKLEAPVGLLWLGNNAVWEYVDGAIGYEVSLYGFDGLIDTLTVTECPIDLTEYSPKDGWTFKVRALSNGTLKDKRYSNYAESPARGSRTRPLNPVSSGNALNMSVNEHGVLTWDVVSGATGYKVTLKHRSMAVTTWDTTNTNLSLVSEIDGIKVDTGWYSVEVTAKGVSGKTASMDYFYTSNVDKLEAPRGLMWLGNNIVWEYVDGVVLYEVTLYGPNGSVDAFKATECPIDLTEYEPKDGWTFKVQALSNGRLNDKRDSAATESPAFQSPKATYKIDLTVFDKTYISTGGGTVFIQTDKGSANGVSLQQTATEDSSVTITAVPDAGYDFVGWKKNSPYVSSFFSENATYTFDATHELCAAEGLYLYAVFEEVNQQTPTYAINCTAHNLSGDEPAGTVYIETDKGGANGETAQKYATENAKVKVRAVAESGFEFVEWRKSSPSDANAVVSTNSTYEFTATEAVLLYAVFRDTSTEYMYYYSPGEANGSGEFDYVTSGTQITLYDPEDLGFIAVEGFMFDYWSIRVGAAMNPESLRKLPGDTITITDNTYIVAIWREAPLPPPPEVEMYMVSIGGVMIDETNYTDVFGDGKVSFDPETRTLTLKEFGYRGFGDIFPMTEQMVGIISKESLRIELIGDSFLIVEEDPEAVDVYPTVGILLVEGDLTFVGSGTLHISASEIGIMGGNEGKITVDGPVVTVEATGTEVGGHSGGIFSHRGVFMTAGALGVVSADYGIFIADDGGNSKINNGVLEMSVGVAGGFFVTSGVGTVALKPLIATYGNAVIIASADPMGDGAGEYKADDLETYKYLRVSPEISHEHTYGQTPNASDESEHWKECTDPECPNKSASAIEKTPHTAVGSHKCSVCNRKVSDCIDSNTDHKCDICSTPMGTHAAASGKHTCNYCGKPVTECADSDKDHKCDVCGADMGTHEAALGKHTCNYCNKAVTECADSNKDHKCDVCSASMGTHAAASGKHTCDYCKKTVSQCNDGNTDHKCDVCGADMGTHEAALGKHTCDYCNKAVSQCADSNNDHKCDVCSASMGTHTAASGKHTCDYCKKTVSECADGSGDGKCDVCGKKIGECTDSDRDHKCDKHGEDMGTHEAALGKHTCNYCNKAVTECDDSNKDHKCDTCNENMGEHKAASGTHICDYCKKRISNCSDRNKDHKCDGCGADMGTHEAAGGGHVCDYCGKAITECEDENLDHKCDICSAEMGTHVEADGKHTCDYCGKTVSECADSDRDHKCDICSADMGIHGEAVGGHVCEYCGETLSRCVDGDGNRICDICGISLGTSEEPETPENPDGDQTPEKPEEDKGGLGAGAIIAIVIGAIVLLSVGGYAILWFVVSGKSFAELTLAFKEKDFAALKSVFNKNNSEKTDGEETNE